MTQFFSMEYRLQHGSPGFHSFARRPLLFVIILPIIQCGLFGLTVGRDPTDLRLAVVNDDTQCDLSGSVSSMASFPGYPSNCTTKSLKRLSCRMLNLIDDHRVKLVITAASSIARVAYAYALKTKLPSLESTKRGRMDLA